MMYNLVTVCQTWKSDEEQPDHRILLWGKSLQLLLLRLHALKQADLAALMARNKLLKDKHELEEEEERIRSKLQMEEDIAAHMAKFRCVTNREHPKWEKFKNKAFGWNELLY